MQRRAIATMSVVIAVAIGCAGAGASLAASDGLASPVRSPRPSKPVQMPTRPSAEAALRSAARGQVECGKVVSESVRLIRDLNCSGDGVIVGCRNDGPPSVTGPVTIDLAGHTIRGSGNWTGFTICSLYTVTIVNGTIRDFGMGTWTNASVTLQRVTIKNNGIG